MIVFIKGNPIELETDLSPIELVALVDIQKRGDIVASISVKRGERVGYIPIEDLDVEKTINNLADDAQLELCL